MEFLFEFLFELIIEGSIELGTSRRVPMVVRVLAILVFLAVYAGIIVAFILIGCSAMQEGSTAAGVLCLAVAFGVALGGIRMIVKKMRRR